MTERPDLKRTGGVTLEAGAGEAQSGPRSARRFHLTGVVQGVGFRPFVHRLATRFGLAGSVRNESGEVYVEVEGTLESLTAFERAIRPEAPPLARIDALDGRLWTYKDESFLAHGRSGRAHSEDQPIYLTTGTENPNGAEALIVVDGAEFSELATGKAETYARTMILFSGKDAEALNQARDMWKEAKSKGLEISYWEQGKSGGWEKRA